MSFDDVCILLSKRGSIFYFDKKPCAGKNGVTRVNDVVVVNKKHNPANHFTAAIYFHDTHHNKL